MDVGPLIHRDEPYPAGHRENEPHRGSGDVEIGRKAEEVLALRVASLRNVLLEGPEPGREDPCGSRSEDQDQAEVERQDERLKRRQQKQGRRSPERHYINSTVDGTSCQMIAWRFVAFAVDRMPSKNCPPGM